MRFIYSLLAYLAAPLISVALLCRGLRDRSYWRHFGERFGFGPTLETPCIWVHGVSMGEVQAAAALVSTLRQRYPEVPIVVTTFTPTGANRARLLFKDLAQVRYLPYDLPGSVRRFFKRVRPRLAVIFETELWPNLYRECGRRRVPLILASARLSPRSVGRYRRLGALFRETLSHGVVVAAQGKVDADRFRALGADPGSTHVTGNLKFDFAVPADIAARGHRLRARYAPGRPVWTAGSTHGGGEEEALIEAHKRVRELHSGALLVMAPRHPNRFGEVASTLERQSVRFIRRSQETSAAAIEGAEVLLLDTLGELLDFYAAADVAFVGGSLVPIGGHNLLEPAALGLPILTGPNNFNSEDVARLLIARGAAEVVTGPQELGDRVAALLSDPAARVRIGAEGRAFVDANRGALVKLMGLIVPLLEQ
ncbi:MAG: 3-deoxy-D-manno-octulosonic acid transferase [Gammaproteobacteria bacterium]|nr:3-deoxy-D-manno-octulosonic acid transferase [Gammaproteobacteria bacterium]